ncbi:MAG: SCP2 sterol-binding domain-containing protein [Desulfobacterota bacterium]|nr:SCP2 sterol-binding domain-containing protein [Thermodesulfobacteriota bacterium]
MQRRIDANPGMLGSLRATIQFQITGPDPGDFFVTIGEGTGKVTEGKAPSPDVTLTMASDDFQDMVEGRLDGMVAFMGGKLKISGDMMLALQLQNLLR